MMATLGITLKYRLIFAIDNKANRRALIPAPIPYATVTGHSGLWEDTPHSIGPGTNGDGGQLSGDQEAGGAAGIIVYKTPSEDFFLVLGARMDCDLPTDCITRVSFVPSTTDLGSHTADSFLPRPSTLPAAPEEDKTELVVEANSKWITSNDKAEVKPVIHFNKTLTTVGDKNKSTTIITTERPSRVEKVFEKGYGGAPVTWTVTGSLSGKLPFMIATFTVMTEGGSAAPGDPANGVLNIIQINATINDAASRARGAARVANEVIPAPPVELTYKFRWMECVVKNETQFSVLFQTTFPDSGRYWTPPGGISPYSQMIFRICNGDNTILTGATGGNAFSIVLDDNTMFNIALGWTAPTLGTYKAGVVESRVPRDGYDIATEYGGAIMSTNTYQAKDVHGNVKRIRFHVSASPGQTALYVINEIIVGVVNVE